MYRSTDPPARRTSAGALRFSQRSPSAAILTRHRPSKRLLSHRADPRRVNYTRVPLSFLRRQVDASGIDGPSAMHAHTRASRRRHDAVTRAGSVKVGSQQRKSASRRGVCFLTSGPPPARASSFSFHPAPTQTTPAAPLRRSQRG